MPVIKLGSNDQNTGGEVTYWQQWFQRYARSYAPPVDGYVGYADVNSIKILQANLARAGHAIVVDGVFGDRTANIVGYRWRGTNHPPVVEERRPIWIYTAPGSGVAWDAGPSFQLGERAKDILKINHQPVGYPIGGYLGFMGGDPKHSYLEVIDFQDKEFERLLDINPDVQRAMDARRLDGGAQVDVEIWVSGYSQSADGFRRSVKRLFGPGGKYAMIRDRLNGIINFGDPGTPVTGIARTSYEPWLEELVSLINYDNDFYAIAPDDIRPAFYGIIIQAEMELPFFVHVLRVAIPVILGFVTPLGGLFGPLGALMVAGMTGLNSMLPMLGGLMGQASQADEEVDQKLIEMLSITGLVKNIGGLIALVGALPGLQAHGRYEFDGFKMDEAYAVMADYRR